MTRSATASGVWCHYSLPNDKFYALASFLSIVSRDAGNANGWQISSLEHVNTFLVTQKLMTCTWRLLSSRHRLSLLSFCQFFIRQILAENEQMRQETDDSGPYDEFEFWRLLAAKYNVILEQIRGHDFRMAVQMLNIAKSKVLKVSFPFVWLTIIKCDRKHLGERGRE